VAILQEEQDLPAVFAECRSLPGDDVAPARRRNLPRLP
jgi:hypothetical protein